MAWYPLDPSSSFFETHITETDVEPDQGGHAQHVLSEPSCCESPPPPTPPRRPAVSISKSRFCVRVLGKDKTPAPPSRQFLHPKLPSSRDIHPSAPHPKFRQAPKRKPVARPSPSDSGPRRPPDQVIPSSRATVRLGIRGALPSRLSGSKF